MSRNLDSRRGRSMRYSMACLRALLGMAIALPAGAQSGPTNPYSYTVSTRYTYRTDGGYAGLLDTTTLEPTIAASCRVSTEGYDTSGNHTGHSVANCAQAPASAQFASRNDSSTAPAVAGQAITVNGSPVSVSYPAGLFATSLLDSLGHTESRQYDPRFGAVLQVTGPDNLVTNVQVDDFGRPVREIRADRTSVISRYCILSSSGLDQSSNTAGCPTPAVNEAPSDAIRFTHTEPQDVNGAQMGPFIRVYYDRMGRELRTVSQSFDGAKQASGRAGALVVKDMVYNALGLDVLDTRPYFLISGSTSTATSGDVGVRSTIYDAFGRAVTTYITDPDGLAGTQSFGGGSTTAYGQYGSRVASKTSVQYSALAVTYVNDKGQRRQEELSPMGQVLRVTDANLAQLSHVYEAFGGLKQTQDALGNQITLSYDWMGRKIQTQDPDKGTWNFTYDAIGQLRSQTSPNQLAQGSATTMTYDALGRMLTRSAAENISTWTYDTCANGVGKLCTVSNSNGLQRTYTYDSLGRMVNKLSSTSTVALPSSASYDASTGHLTAVTYPTGLVVGYSYTALGYVEKMNLNTPAVVNPLPSSAGGTPGASVTMASGSLLWQATVIDAGGRFEQQVYGNNVVQRTTFEAGSGRVTDIVAGLGAATNVMNQHYGWDSQSNMTSRSDTNGDGSGNAVTEQFSYGDNLNRLTSYSVSAPGIPNFTRTVTLQYNALGMLLSKSDVGNYSYGNSGSGAVRPHALLGVVGDVNSTFTYDANGNVKTSSSGKYSAITYNSFDMPDSTGIAGSGSGPSYAYLYDEEHSRVREVRTAPSASGSGNDVRTTWYDHPDGLGSLNFEYEVNAPAHVTAATPAVNENRHFLVVAGQTVGVLVSEGTLSAAAVAPPAISSITLRKVEYWHRDHLGSLITTTDHAAFVTQRYAYDPFGKRRYTNGNYDAFGHVIGDWNPATNGGTARGFTGHEHIDDVGLINMNGRIFDPTLGVFLQADPHVTDPWDLQNFNRYGYCLNNPLTCVDPSGFDQVGEGPSGDPIFDTPIPEGGGPSGYYTNGFLVNISGIPPDPYADTSGTAPGDTPHYSTPMSGNPISSPDVTPYVPSTSAFSTPTVNIADQISQQVQQQQAQFDAWTQQAQQQAQALARAIAVSSYLRAQAAAAAAAAALKTGPIGAVMGQSNLGNILSRASRAVSGFSASGVGEGFRAAVTGAQFIPVLSTAAGLVGAGIDIYDGNYGSAALSVGSMIPLVGDGFAAARVARAATQVHHLIPNAVYRNLNSAFPATYIQNHAKNLLELTVPFHGNHPAYNKYVTSLLNDMQKEGPLTLDRLKGLQNGLRDELTALQASGQWERLNHYYLSLGFK